MKIFYFVLFCTVCACLMLVALLPETNDASSLNKNQIKVNVQSDAFKVNYEQFNRMH